jgi:autotransporter strand-loop-strand O-heptosyltransferase
MSDPLIDAEANFTPTEFSGEVAPSIVSNSSGGLSESTASSEATTLPKAAGLHDGVTEDTDLGSNTFGQDAPSRSWPRPAEIPTQNGPSGAKFDFNSGCRVLVPNGGVPWRVRITDLDTGNVLFQTKIDGGRVTSSKRYFVRGRIEIQRQGEEAFVHDYDATDKSVLINFPGGTLGDTIGWMTYAARFRAKHRCRLTCAMTPVMIPLFRDVYPEIEFLEHKNVNAGQFYASYYLGLFFDDAECIHQPCDFRLVGLHRTAGYLLGVDPIEEPPRIAIPDTDNAPLDEPYICIATQATSQAKYWNNPYGWHEIIAFLKEAGYRVVCLDRQKTHGTGLVWNHIPHGVEDRTDLSLQDCARWLKHCEFFIGLSSGLSWLAWAAGAKVVMISGFSHPTTEFNTPWRVINYHACNSCWNDPAMRFDHKDFLWCPRHTNGRRQFECTRLITGEMVKRTIGPLIGANRPRRRTD